jgi:glycerophosphoryl diester phosphodiesterase
MAVIETWVNQDLQKPVKVQYIDGSLFSNNGNGNRIGVNVYDNGEAVTLTGSVSGYAVLSDGTTVPCTGARTGNKASILVPPAAYVPGALFLSVFLTDGETVTTLAAVSTSVLLARTDSQVDPGTVVADWTQTINGAMQDVQTSAENLGQIVATPYASLTYPVPLGKYTYYNGNLYRCVSPIASSESFTPAHWSNPINLGDEVSALKSAYNYEKNTILIKKLFSDTETSETVWRSTADTRLKEDGHSETATGWTIYKYSRSAAYRGTFVHVKGADGYMQFQTGDSVPASGDITRVGGTYSAEDIYLLWPDETTYLMVSSTSEPDVITVVDNDPYYHSAKTASAQDKVIIQNRFIDRAKLTHDATVAGRKIDVTGHAMSDARYTSYRYSGYGNTGKIVHIIADGMIQFQSNTNLPHIGELSGLIEGPYQASNSYFLWPSTGYLYVSSTSEPTVYICDATDGTIALTLNDGYLGTNGSIYPPTEKAEKYTDLIPILKNATYRFMMETSSTDSYAMWMCSAEYDEAKKFIRRTTIIGSGSKTGTFDVDITPSNDASFFVLTYRTYNVYTGRLWYLKSVMDALQTNIAGLYELKSIVTDNYADLFSQIPKSNIVKSINHRGLNGVAPESTTPAFVASKKYGFHYVETDVRFTSDNVPVLLHDSTINRTARNDDGTEITETIAIADITYEQALTYDFGIFKGSQFAGTRILSFDDFIKLCKFVDLHPYVEISRRTQGQTAFTKEQVQSLVAIADKYNMKENITWISFAYGYLAYIAEADEKARLGYLVESTVDSTILSNATSLKTGENEVFIDIIRTATAEDIQAIKNAGFPVEIYTCNTAEQITGMNDYVTGVTSDGLIASDVLRAVYIS